MRHSPPLGACGGKTITYNGLNEVFDYFGRLQQSGPAFILEVHSLLADDEHGVALLVGTAKRASKRIEQKVVHDFHLNADGKITGWWNFWEDQPALDDLFAYASSVGCRSACGGSQQDRWPLAVLYVCYNVTGLVDEVAGLIENAPPKYVKQAGTDALRGLAARVATDFPYFWFLFNDPPLYDRYNYCSHHASNEELAA